MSKKKKKIVEEEWIECSCACCKKCRKKPNSPTCFYGGPYGGFVKVDFNEEPIDD